MQSLYQGPLVFRLGGLSFRPLMAHELEAAFRLRHRFVCEDMQWLPPHPSGQEFDAWDGLDDPPDARTTVHVGAFDGDRLVGYLRMVPDSLMTFPGTNDLRRTMTLTIFRGLITTPLKRTPVERTADISRWVFDKDYARQCSRRQIGNLYAGLFWVAYQAASRMNIRYWTFVTGRRVFRLLRWACRFPVENIGSGITSDGKRNYALFLDLQASAKRVRWANPRFHRWFVIGLVPEPVDLTTPAPASPPVGVALPAQSGTTPEGAAA